MRLSTFLIVLFASMVSQSSSAQDGAWGADVDGSIYQLLISNGAFAFTSYKSSDGEFNFTLGGLIKEEASPATFLVEFSSADSTLIGLPHEWAFQRSGSEVEFTFEDKALHLIDLEPNSESALAGSWLFSGRERNGEITRRSTDQPRKTMKILTGEHFQWIAYHITDKKFLGSGGGKYSAVDGVYTENIEFFSRDKNRVGASLPFEFERIEDEWHHKGKSSKGDPMYEIWSLRK